jgi:hypothetical protein
LRSLQPQTLAGNPLPETQAAAYTHHLHARQAHRPQTRPALYPLGSYGHHGARNRVRPCTFYSWRGGISGRTPGQSDHSRAHQGYYATGGIAVATVYALVSADLRPRPRGECCRILVDAVRALAVVRGPIGPVGLRTRHHFPKLLHPAMRTIQRSNRLSQIVGCGLKARDGAAESAARHTPKPGRSRIARLGSRRRQAFRAGSGLPVRYGERRDEPGFVGLAAPLRKGADPAPQATMHFHGGRDHGGLGQLWKRVPGPQHKMHTRSGTPVRMPPGPAHRDRRATLTAPPPGVVGKARWSCRSCIRWQKWSVHLRERAL